MRFSTLKQLRRRMLKVGILTEKKPMLLAIAIRGCGYALAQMIRMMDIKLIIAWWEINDAPRPDQAQMLICIFLSGDFRFSHRKTIRMAMQCRKQVAAENCTVDSLSHQIQFHLSNGNPMESTRKMSQTAKLQRNQSDNLRFSLSYFIRRAKWLMKFRIKNEWTDFYSARISENPFVIIFTRWSSAWLFIYEKKGMQWTDWTFEIPTVQRTFSLFPFTYLNKIFLNSIRGISSELFVANFSFLLFVSQKRLSTGTGEWSFQ